MKMVMRKRRYSEEELKELFDDDEDSIVEYLATDGRYFEGEEEWPDRYYDEYYDDY
jgi:hypothetical protein